MDPLKQFQGLLDDPRKTLEKISQVRAALESLRSSTTGSEPEDVAPLSPGADSNPGKEPSGDPPYGRVLQALVEMRAQIEEHIKPLAAQMAQREVVRLRGRFEEQHNILKECLAHIDQSLMTCFARMEEYRRRSVHLASLNDRLVELGGTPEPLPDARYEDAAQSILARLENLRLAGKV